MKKQNRGICLLQFLRERKERKNTTFVYLVLWYSDSVMFFNQLCEFWHFLLSPTLKVKKKDFNNSQNTGNEAFILQWKCKICEILFRMKVFELKLFPLFEKNKARLTASYYALSVRPKSLLSYFISAGQSIFWTD